LMSDGGMRLGITMVCGRAFENCTRRRSLTPSPASSSRSAGPSSTFASWFGCSAAPPACGHGRRSHPDAASCFSYEHHDSNTLSGA
jgi:hypothetical protein